MATLGEAYIEVHADTKPFARELGVQLKAILKEVDKSTQGDAVKLGQHLAQGVAEGVDKDGEKIRRSVRKVGKKVENETKTWGDRLRAPFDKLAKGNFILTRVFGEFISATIKGTQRILKLAGAVGKVGVAVAELGAEFVNVAVTGLKLMVTGVGDAAGALSGFGAAAAKVGSSLVALLAELASFAPAAFAAVAAVALLTAALVALLGVLAVIVAPFATLVNLMLALPAALTVLLAIIGPLVVGFHGLGDAIKLAFEKDPKKFAQGLKLLSPIMQRIALAFREIRGTLDGFKNAVQTALLGPILTILEPALKRILPQLQASFVLVADALGNLLLQILKFVSQQSTLDLIANVMGQIALFLQNNTGAIIALITALGAAAQAALPIVLELFTKFGDFFIRFAEWIEGAITDGRFEKWLDTALKNLGAIWNLIQSIINLFTELFGQTEEGGRKFLEKITATLDKITAWMKSPEGKQSIKDIVDLANLFADALEEALKFVKLTLNTFLAIADVIKWIRDHPIPLGAITGIGGIINDQFSGGGVVPRDEVAMVHKGEPILDPANTVGKNRAILAEAGMLDVLEPQAPTINVFVGNEQLDARTDYRIAKANRVTARTLATGART